MLSLYMMPSEPVQRHFFNSFVENLPNLKQLVLDSFPGSTVDRLLTDVPIHIRSNSLQELVVDQLLSKPNQTVAFELDCPKLNMIVSSAFLVGPDGGGVPFRLNQALTNRDKVSPTCKHKVTFRALNETIVFREPQVI